MAELSEPMSLSRKQRFEPKANILLVDDNPANLLSLRAILEDLGQNLVEASSGEEALRRMKSQEFAVILLDVLMPGISGFETAKQIRSDERSRHTPIIFLTAGDMDRPKLEEGYALGAVDFLVKPLLPIVLKAKVRNFVHLFQENERARQEAEQLRLLVQGTSDYAIFMLDPEGRILTWNAGAERLKGYRADEIIGQHFSRFYPPDAIARAWPQHELRVARSEGRFEDEGWRVRKDGTRFWANVVITALRDDGGHLRGFGKVTRDMTERKKAEESARRLVEESAARRAAEENARIIQMQREALSQSEQRTRIVLESITDAFFAVDRDWRFTYVNPQAERLLDRKPGDLLGQDMWEVYPGLIGSEFELAYRRVAAERVTLWVTAFYPDHERWYEVHVYPATDGISIYFQDVSERKRAEAEVDRLTQAAEQQRRIFETALSNSADFNYVFDLQGRFAYVNKPLLALWGKNLQEAVGKSFFDLDYPFDLATRLQRQIQEVIETQQPVRDETPYTSSSGERQYEYIFVPVLGATGIVEAVAGSTRDITDRKRVEAELRNADRRKDEFLATLAHELRNPLAPIRNSLQILKMPRVDAATAQQTREMMERQVHHLVRLVDDLLDVSRVMRGKIELRKERVELATVVARAVEIAQPLIEVQGHQLDLSFPSDSLLLDADPVRLAQVVGNLLTNAAKYTEANGRIWLTADRENDRAVLRIRDNGIGIAPDMLPHIFELFVQVDHVATRSQGGLGIGLTLVKNLVEKHGGTVEASSAGLGKGCEFIIRLPLISQKCGGPNERANELQHQEPLSSGKRLLVVDDNQDAALSLATLMRLQGHEVRVAHDGTSALEVATSYRPDMVLLDIGMPGMDGYEVARRMRQLPGLQKIVLAALTGWGQHKDRRRTAEAGFDYHLVKPVEPKCLESLLADVKLARADGEMQ
jgi:PAS domain S-box-containing protein